MAARFHEWKKDDDELIVFRTCNSPLDFALIRGVLDGNDIPYVAEGHDYYGRLATIRVPRGRLEEAERALEEAQRIGEEMPGDEDEEEQ